MSYGPCFGQRPIRIADIGAKVIWRRLARNTRVRRAIIVHHRIVHEADGRRAIAAVLELGDEVCGWLGLR